MHGVIVPPQCPWLGRMVGNVVNKWIGVQGWGMALTETWNLHAKYVCYLCHSLFPIVIQYVWIFLQTVFGPGGGGDKSVCMWKVSGLFPDFCDKGSQAAILGRKEICCLSRHYCPRWIFSPIQYKVELGTCMLYSISSSFASWQRPNYFKF